MLPTTLKQNVKAGAKLLDEEFPNWFSHIDCKKLNQGDISFCVLGQLFGDYHTGLTVLSLTPFDYRYTYGYSCRGTNTREQANKAWKKQIKKRLRNG
jgi:hypothetical protein